MASAWQEEKIRNDIADAFGELNERQLWSMINFARHCRKYCRSNAALKNFANKTFPNAVFSEVVKVDDRNGEQFKALQIRMKSNGSETSG